MSPARKQPPSTPLAAGIASAPVENTLTGDAEPWTVRTGDDSTASMPLVEVPDEHYAVEGEQGRGGIGVVLRARDRRLDRPVALKQLQRMDGSGRERFEREMRVTARLQHPGVVPVHEAGVFADGQPFYAMKLVEGQSLKEKLADTNTLDERLALLPHVLAVAETIAYAHSKKIIHRDLKPSNIIVGEYGETVVIDWGLAKDLVAADEPAIPAGPYRTPSTGDLTQHGQVVGTPAYMPPEQARGEEVDERADVYALGSILYHVLAGKAPFSSAQSADVLHELLAGPPPPLSKEVRSIRKELVALVEKAISRDPDARYHTAGEFADDLQRFSRGQLVRARVRSHRPRRALGPTA